MQRIEELPLWGSALIDMDDDTTKQFAIEPFGFELWFGKWSWYDVLVNKRKTTIITGLANNEHLNGKNVKIIQAFFHNRLNYEHFYVEPVGWKLDNNTQVPENSTQVPENYAENNTQVPENETEEEKQERLAKEEKMRSKERGKLMRQKIKKMGEQQRQQALERALKKQKVNVKCVDNDELGSSSTGDQDNNEVKIFKKDNQILINMNNLQLSTSDKQDRFKLTLDYGHRFKKESRIGVCFYASFKCVGYGVFIKPKQIYIHNRDRWYANLHEWKSSAAIGVPCGSICDRFYDLTYEDMLQHVRGIKFEVRIYQILEYPVDIKYVPEKADESKAKNIIKDQNEIQQFLQPLMYRPDELMNELKSNNNTIKKENYDLKQQLAELKQWKIEQLKKEEKDEKDIEEAEFNVAEWLKQIHLENGELLLVVFSLVFLIVFWILIRMI